MSERSNSVQSSIDSSIVKPSSNSRTSKLSERSNSIELSDNEDLEDKASISDKKLVMKEKIISKILTPYIISTMPDTSKSHKDIGKTKIVKSDLEFFPETDPEINDKKAMQFYLDGIHDFHINIFKIPEEDLPKQGYDTEIVKKCINSGFGSISTLESDYLQSILRGDSASIFNTNDIQYHPATRG